MRPFHHLAPGIGYPIFVCQRLPVKRCQSIFVNEIVCHGRGCAEVAGRRFVQERYVSRRFSGLGASLHWMDGDVFLSLGSASASLRYGMRSRKVEAVPNGIGTRAFSRETDAYPGC